MIMFDKLEDTLLRYEEVLNELSEPDVLNDQSRYQKLIKELQKTKIDERTVRP